MRTGWGRGGKYGERKTNRKERSRKNEEREEKRRRDKDEGGARVRRADNPNPPDPQDASLRIRGATSARGHAPPPSQYAPCHQPVPTFLSSPAIMLRGNRADGGHVAATTKS